MNPTVKLFMQLTKPQLEHKCRALNLPADGTKLNLAKRLAAHREKRSSQDWEAISKGIQRR